MQGLSPNTLKIFEPVSNLECIKGWILTGGTALAIQLGHRLSEDLDFMRWQSHKGEKMDVNWVGIKAELENIGVVSDMDILDFNHVEFVVSGVKLSFYARESRPPIMEPKECLNNIVLADVRAIAAMKTEVLLRRSKFRDYYDIYSILTDTDCDLHEIIDLAGKYSNHTLKSRNVLAMLTNSYRFKKDSNFEQLQPKYDVTPLEIEAFIKSLITTKR